MCWITESANVKAQIDFFGHKIFSALVLTFFIIYPHLKTPHKWNISYNLWIKQNVNWKPKAKVSLIDFTRNNKSHSNSYGNCFLRSGPFKGQRSFRNNNSLDFDCVYLSLFAHLIFLISQCNKKTAE